MSLSRVEDLGEYADKLLALVPYLLPHIRDKRAPVRRWLIHSRRDERAERSGDERSLVALVLGSERGLCGQYNHILIDELGSYLQKKQDKGVKITLVALGSRLIRELRRQEYEPDVTRALSVTRLPSYELAREFVDQWLTDYESYIIDAVDVIYNVEVGATNYTPKIFRLIPPSPPLQALAPSRADSQVEHVRISDSREKIIIESDPVGIYARIIEQWTTTTAYLLMLEAAGTEHAARYQLMESATQNAEALIETLTRDIKTGRRRTITQEMQELAVAAGMLGK
jgi:F-type H+-transporting ATPase subunit gamma